MFTGCVWLEGKAKQLGTRRLNSCLAIPRFVSCAGQDLTDVIHEKQGKRGQAQASCWAREQIKQIGISFLQATARAPSTCRLLHHEALRLAGRDKQRPRHAQSTTNTEDLTPRIWRFGTCAGGILFDRGDSCVTVVEFTSLESRD
jgi:hypothetical protein